MDSQATLHFFCGKMAAGKSTLANDLAAKNNAILISEDNWLSLLYADEIKTIPEYIKYSAHLREVLSGHIQSILAQGISVVLDFPANTRKQRDWFRIIYENSQSLHALHYIELADDVCKQQLRKRNKTRKEDAPFTSEAVFDEITKYFQPPADDEMFTVIKYSR